MSNQSFQDEPKVSPSNDELENANSRKATEPLALPTWLHLLPLTGLVVPFGNILAPGLLWLLKKQEYPEVDRVGREVLSFQVSLSLYAIGFILFAMIPVLGWVLSILLLPVLFLFGIYVIYLVVKATLASQRGEFFVYPHKLKFITQSIDEL